MNFLKKLLPKKRRPLLVPALDERRRKNIASFEDPATNTYSLWCASCGSQFVSPQAALDHCRLGTICEPKPNIVPDYSWKNETDCCGHYACLDCDTVPVDADHTAAECKQNHDIGLDVTSTSDMMTMTVQVDRAA